MTKVKSRSSPISSESVAAYHELAELDTGQTSRILSCPPVAIKFVGSSHLEKENTNNFQFASSTTTISSILLFVKLTISNPD